MKRWQVIAMVLVIFASGAATGALALRASANRAAAERDPLPPSLMDLRLGALETMQRELALTTDQTRRIEDILQEGRQRTREIWETCQPQFRTEFKRVRDLISAELNPDQQARFEDLLKRSRERHKGGRPDKGAEKPDKMGEKFPARPENPAEHRSDVPTAPPPPAPASPHAPAQP